MTDKYEGLALCKGSWTLGTACGTCQRCIDTEPKSPPNEAIKLSEAKARLIEYCRKDIDFLEGDQCSIIESSEGIPTVDFLESVEAFTNNYGAELPEDDFCRIERHPVVGQILLEKYEDDETERPGIKFQVITPDGIRVTLETLLKTEEDRDTIYRKMTGAKLIDMLQNSLGEIFK